MSARPTPDVCPNRLDPARGVRSVADCCDNACRYADADLDAARQRGPHRLGCPAGDRDPDGIDRCECEPVQVTR